jgi:FKBP-type peptidyl-prolyl cis-trans isomerase
MEKSRVITTLSIIAIVAISGTLFYLMNRDIPEGSSSLPAPSPSMQTQNTELKVEILSEGSGVEIKSGQTAVVYYQGSLDDGSIFDKNLTGDGFVFPLGAGRVIQGWDLGVVGMKVGEKRRLTIPASLGYGASGFPGVIPPNATLHFDVELRAIR